MYLAGHRNNARLGLWKGCITLFLTRVGSMIAATPFEWSRAYVALDRSGLVNEKIRACEVAWGTEFAGNVGVVDAIRKTPGYSEYVKALRSSLQFPLLLYRVMSAEAFKFWTETQYSKPVAATLSL